MPCDLIHACDMYVVHAHACCGGQHAHVVCLIRIPRAHIYTLSWLGLVKTGSQGFLYSQSLLTTIRAATDSD